MGNVRRLPAQWQAARSHCRQFAPRQRQYPRRRDQTLECRNGELTRSFKGVFTTVAFSSDSALLAGADHNGIVHLWNPETGQEIRQWRANSGEIYSLVFSTLGRVLASDSGSI